MQGVVGQRGQDKIKRDLGGKTDNEMTDEEATYGCLSFLAR